MGDRAAFFYSTVLYFFVIVYFFYFGENMKEDNFFKYPKIYNLEHKNAVGVLDGNVILQEKYDGKNFRIARDKEEILWGSHHVIRNTSDEFIVAKDMLTPLMVYVPENWILFGEIINDHNIKEMKTKHIRYGEKFRVIIFDVMQGGIFLHPDKFSWLRDVGFDVIDNYVYLGSPKEAAEKIVKSMQDYKHEGLVLKNYERQIFAKIKLPKFRELERGRGEHKYIKDRQNINEWLFLETYITRERVIHGIQRLEERGEYEASKKIMPKLYGMVFNDALEEEFDSFWRKHNIDSFNFRQARKMAGRYVAHFLELILDGVE